MNRGYACIALNNPKIPANIGGVLRAAYVFNAALVVVKGRRYKRVPTDTPDASQHLPLIQIEDLKGIAIYDCVPVAIEIKENSTLLPEYKHPMRALYIFGPEDGSIENSVLLMCRDVVTIPSKKCLNLAAAVNVVLYDRMAKNMQVEKFLREQNNEI